MSITIRLATCLPILLLSGIVFAEGQVCDVDVDGDVDIADIRLISAARNQPATGPDDPRDANGDGTITVLDARTCVRLCTLPRCVVPPPNDVPIADAGNGQTVETGDTVTLDGSGSSDADGNPLQFSWLIVSAPATSSASLSDSSAVMPTFVADVAGEYVIELIVNDGIADSAPDETVVVTVPGNTVPVADAGPDQTIQLGDTVALDGSASFDVDLDALTFMWTLTFAPAGSAATLSDSTAESPTFVADLPGVYVAELLVDDGQAGSTPDTVSISTANSRPVADAGPDQAVDPNDLVQLNGDGSFDADKDPLTFSWSLTTVPDRSTATLGNPTTVMPTFVADLPGIYVAQLIVNDGSSKSMPDTVVINSDDQPPTAIAAIRDANGAPVADGRVPFGADFILDGSQSFDTGGGTIVSYLWTDLQTGRQVERPDSMISMSIFLNGGAALAIGQHHFQLVVTDDGGNESVPDLVTVIIVDNERPTAVTALLDVGGRLVDWVPFGADFILDGSQSADTGGGSIVRYSWTDLQTGRQVETVDSTIPMSIFLNGVVALAVGQHQFELVVTDDSGNESAPAILTVIVVDIEPPVAVIEIRDSTGRPVNNGQLPLGENFILDGSQSADTGGGIIARYSWTVVDASTPSPVTTAAPTITINELSMETRTVPSLGRNVYELVVEDDSGNESAPVSVAVDLF